MAETMAHLQTAQNRMHDGISAEIDRMHLDGRLEMLLENPMDQTDLFIQLRTLVLDLLNIPPEQQNQVFVCLGDSGKRSIDMIVNAFMPDVEHSNIFVGTENYVGHNAWSAMKAMNKLKSVPFHDPFDLTPGQALTVGHDAEMEKLGQLFQTGISTLYCAWNGTSTGVAERMDALVSLRNQHHSHALVVGDGSSLPILSNDWIRKDASLLPDILFCSFRKHLALPYKGKQDELEQMKNSGSLIVFNQRALDRARSVGATPIYDNDLVAAADGVHSEDPKIIIHGLKLKLLLESLLANDREGLAVIDAIRQAAHKTVSAAFADDGVLGGMGYQLLADPRAQSTTAYVVKVPDDLVAMKLVKTLDEVYGVKISPALHPQANSKQHNIVRFAMYSANSMEEIDILLKSIAQATQDFRRG